MAEAWIEVDHLVAHYGDTLVLDDVSLAVNRSEIFLIIGGSGCGKTTLIKHMTGLLKPTSGSVRHGGVEITSLEEDRLAEVQRGIGIAFQSGGLFNSMTVGENVALPLREYGQVDDNLIEGIVRMKLSLVGLAGAQHLLPEQLSGGMRKRASLARALALDPPVVYFDEPSAGLDPIIASGLDNLIIELNKLLGITFIIVTHELASIRIIAHRAVMLDKGRVIFSGTTEEAEKAGPPRVRQFFERRPDEFIM